MPAAEIRVVLKPDFNNNLQVELPWLFGDFQFVTKQTAVFWGMVGWERDVLCPVTWLAKDLGRLFVLFEKGASKD